MRKPNRTVTLMLTAAAVLVIMVAYAMGSVMAQVSVENECPDYCDTKIDTLYQKGYWDDKLRICVYTYEELCKYGCEDDTRISTKPACKEFPDKPPENQTELDSTSWEMIKRLYDKKRIEVSMEVYGTEYQVTDSGKVFVQLLDSDNQPIVNSTCFSTIYYPNATKYVDSQAMTYADEGLYHYDISLLPNITGVYMVSAFCYIPSLNETNVSYDDVECNDYDCGTGWLDDWITTSTTYWDVITDNPYLGTYHFEASNDFNAYRTFNASGYESIMVEFYSACRDIDNNEYFYFQICDSNNVCYYRMTWGELNCRNFYEHNSFTVSNDTFDMDNNVSIRITTSGNLENSDFMYFDEFQVWGYNYANDSEYQLVRGSGELHITDYYDNLTVLIGNATKQEIAEYVWNYSNRSLTDYNFSEIIGYLQAINATVYLVNDTVYSISDFQLNELSDNLTEIQLYLQDINSTVNNNYNWLIGLVNLSVSDVWGYQDRNLTYFNYTPIYNRLDELNSTVHIKLDQILANLSSVNSTLYQAVVDSNSSIIARMDAHNGTIMTKLYSLQTELSDVNTSLWGAIVDANSSIIAEIGFTNSSLYNALVDANVSIIGRLDSHNGTIMTELYAVRQDIQDLNTSNQARYDLLNSTIMGKLYSMQDELADILQAVNDTNSSILLRLDQHNNTIMTKLYLMQDEIASVNDSTNNLANLTAQQVWSYSNRSLTEFNFTVEINDSDILGAISLANSSLYQAIVDSNSSMLQAIIDSNTSIIGRLDSHNNTIMLKLYSLQTDIANLNDLSASDVWSYASRTLTDYNQTEIINLLNNINTTMYNLTIGNITVSASVNWTEGTVEMNNISNPTVIESQLLTFAGRDQTPTQSFSRAYCMDNSTLAYDINTTRCFLDQCFTINETFTEICDYGCYQGSCNPEPFDRITFLALLIVAIMVVIIGMAFAYDRFSR